MDLDLDMDYFFEDTDSDLDLTTDPNYSCVYTEARLPAFAGYDAPPLLDLSGGDLGGLALKRNRRILAINGDSFEAGSPNSTRMPYYPGVQPRGQASRELPPSDSRRFDGQLGPRDPTISPQHYDPYRPWLPYIRRGSSELAHTEIFKVWGAIPDYYLGSLHPNFVDALCRKHREADRKISELKAHSHDRSITEASIYLTTQESLEDVHKIRKFSCAVDVCRKLQRELLEKCAWIDMVSNSGRCRMTSINDEPSKVDDRYMGLWINGANLPSQRLLTYLCAGVPCFLIRPIIVLNKTISTTRTSSYLDPPELADAVQHETLEGYEFHGKHFGATVVPSAPAPTTTSISFNDFLRESKHKKLMLSTGPHPLNVEDFLRVARKRFLNDALIQFSLGLWSQSASIFQENGSPQVSELFVYNSYFYETLSKRGSDGVKDWNRPNLKTTRYLVLPINDQTEAHWYLAVAYIPNLSLSIQSNRRRAFPINAQFWIIDSMGEQRTTALNKLESYLKKLAEDQCLNLSIAAGVHLQVPRQPNNIDCGVHLLHYAREFIIRPAKFIEDIMKKTFPPTWDYDNARSALQTLLLPPVYHHFHTHYKRSNFESMSISTDSGALNPASGDDIISIPSDSELEIVSLDSDSESEPEIVATRMRAQVPASVAVSAVRTLSQVAKPSHEHKVSPVLGKSSGDDSHAPYKRHSTMEPDSHPIALQHISSTDPSPKSTLVPVLPPNSSTAESRIPLPLPAMLVSVPESQRVVASVQLPQKPQPPQQLRRVRLLLSSDSSTTSPLPKFAPREPVSQQRWYVSIPPPPPHVARDVKILRARNRRTSDGRIKITDEADSVSLRSPLRRSCPEQDITGSKVDVQPEKEDGTVRLVHPSTLESDTAANTSLTKALEPAEHACMDLDPGSPSLKLIKVGLPEPPAKPQADPHVMSPTMALKNLTECMKGVVQTGPEFDDSVMGGFEDDSGDAVDELGMGCLPQVHGSWEAGLQDNIRDELRARRVAFGPVYIPPPIQSGMSSQGVPASPHKKTRRAGKKDESGRRRKRGRQRGFNKAQFEAWMKQRSGVAQYDNQ
ncbi:hypothetical protein R3P38DRAFT_3194814 [Favolaschia claudopus]|uniref:Ubiquitin-like protease family profile domain-containing protein n=1 Tax=Favolaschia claudopus TaxID=2862362 RepID=A0AAW0BDY2_9AGAR